MIRRVVGALLLALIFGGLFALYAADEGWRAAAVVFVGGGLLAAAVIGAVALLAGDSDGR